MKNIILMIALLVSGGWATAQKPMSGQLSKNTKMNEVKEIYFAGGCFWGTEHFMKQINGVVHTQVGYANGKRDIMNPTYEQVCNDNTGFAETVKVGYNPQQADLELLIDLFFKTIDPTSLNRQGNDRGSQYQTGSGAFIKKIRQIGGRGNRAVEKLLSGRRLSSGLFGQASRRLLPHQPGLVRCGQKSQYEGEKDDDDRSSKEVPKAG